MVLSTCVCVCACLRIVGEVSYHRGQDVIFEKRTHFYNPGAVSAIGVYGNNIDIRPV